MQVDRNYLQKLDERYHASHNHKMRWYKLARDIFNYVLPNRNSFNVEFGYDDSGIDVTQHIWDDTAVLAAEQRANDLHGLLMPQDRIWGKYGFHPDFVSEQQQAAAKPLLDTVNKIVHWHISQSNLATVANAALLDLTAGMGALWVDSSSRFSPLSFTAIPAYTLNVESTSSDTIETAWWPKRLLGRQIIQNYPQYNGEMLQELKDKPNDHFHIRMGHIALDKDKNDETQYLKYAVLEDDPTTPLFSNISTVKQLIAFRDFVRPGETEGRGIATTIINTIKDLNKTVYNDRQSLAQKARPPIFYDDNMDFNPFSVKSWSGLLIPRQPGTTPMEVMQTPTSPEVEQKIMALQEKIKDAFKVDPLGDVESPVKSATEVSIRENRAQRTSATDISRLINELPKQIYEISAHILMKRGLLGKTNVRRLQLRFEYVSPLYQIQKQQNVQNLEQYEQFLQQFFGAEATLLGTNLPKVAAYLADNLDIPSKLIPSETIIQRAIAHIGQQGQPQQNQQGMPAPALMPPQASTTAQPVPAIQLQGVAA